MGPWAQIREQAKYDPRLARSDCCHHGGNRQGNFIMGNHAILSIPFVLEMAHNRLRCSELSMLVLVPCQCSSNVCARAGVSVFVPFALVGLLSHTRLEAAPDVDQKWKLYTSTARPHPSRSLSIGEASRTMSVVGI